MTYLLDTHTLIWALTSPEKLSQNVRSLISQQDNNFVVSVISFWEISLKQSTGRMVINGISPEELPSLCSNADLTLLSLDATTCATFHELPNGIHRDPFDRMLIWQAKCLNYTLISKDERIGQYAKHGVKVVW